MFRVEKTEKFGVGTVVVFDTAHLLIALDKKKVGALNVKTLEVDSSVAVEDPHWITRKEFEELFRFTNCTLSDFVLRPGADLTKGVKTSYN